MTPEEKPPYSGTPAQPSPGPRVRIHHLAQAKAEGRKFTMLTAYDTLMASLFDEAGVEVLLVGDSAANNVLGHASTLPITVDEMVMFSAAVARGAERSLVVADLPFGSYEASVEQAVSTGVRFMKEGHVHAVKMEGGAYYAEHIRALTQAGVPVIAHIGFTPQSEHALGGYRVQGRGDDAAAALIEDALALEAAGAFAVLMEMVPAQVAARVDAALKVPTIGIGAGGDTTGQVLVWQDMLGLRQGKVARFVKQYADLKSVVHDAVTAYREDVASGAFPAPEHTF